MAGGPTLKFEGVDNLFAALDEFKPATQRAVLQRVLLKAGKPMQEEAQRLAPERPADSPAEFFRRNGAKVLRRIGTLKILVQIGTRLTPRQASQARAEGKNFAEVYIGTRDPVGRLREFGTRRAPAQPFLRPAFDNHKDEAMEIIAREMAVELEAAAARARRRALKRR